MLPRTLEPTAANAQSEAIAYQAMDHSRVNQQFVDDLIAGGPVGNRVIDLGCGPALIPICLYETIQASREHGQRAENLRIMGVDGCAHMLHLARLEIEFAGLNDRIELQQIDLTRPGSLQPDIADMIICNTVLHHLPDPGAALELAINAMQSGGRLFIRDLVRPDSTDAIEALVRLHAPDDADSSEVPPELQPSQLLRQSFHASLTLAEIQSLGERHGIPRDRVGMTSDRHWTLDCVLD